MGLKDALLQLERVRRNPVQRESFIGAIRSGPSMNSRPQSGLIRRNRPLQKAWDLGYAHGTKLGGTNFRDGSGASAFLARLMLRIEDLPWLSPEDTEGLSSLGLQGVARVEAHGHFGAGFLVGYIEAALFAWSNLPDE